MNYSMVLRKIIIGACVLMFTTSALKQRDVSQLKGGIQTNKEDTVGCHYQTLADPFGFDHNFGFWNSWRILIAPYYLAPRRVGFNSVMTGVAYYNWGWQH